MIPPGFAHFLSIFWNLVHTNTMFMNVIHFATTGVVDRSNTIVVVVGFVKHERHSWYVIHGWYANLLNNHDQMRNKWPVYWILIYFCYLNPKRSYGLFSTPPKRKNYLEISHNWGLFWHMSNMFTLFFDRKVVRNKPFAWKMGGIRTKTKIKTSQLATNQKILLNCLNKNLSALNT